MILIERKALAAAQRRLDPSILGRRGVLQIIADVVKPLFKGKLLMVVAVTATLGVIVLCCLSPQTVCAVMYGGAGASSVVALREFITILQVIFINICMFSLYIIDVLLIIVQLSCDQLINILFINAELSYAVCAVYGHFIITVLGSLNPTFIVTSLNSIIHLFGYLFSSAICTKVLSITSIYYIVGGSFWWIFGSETPIEPKKVYNPWEGYEGIIYPSDIFISFFIYMAIVCMYLIIYISVISKTWGAPYKRSNFVWIFVWALLTFGFGYFWIRCYFFGYESLWAFRQIFTTLQMTLHYLGMYYLNHLMFGNFVCYGILHLPIALLVDNLLKDFLTKELRIFLWIAAILVLLGYIVYLGPEYLIYTSVLKNQALLRWFPINGCPYDVTDILLGRSFACTILCGFLWRLASGLPELFWLDPMTDAQGRLTGYYNQDHLGAMPFIWPWYICTRLYARERPWLPKFKKAYCNAFWHGWLGFAICAIVNFTIFGACGWYLWSL